MERIENNVLKVVILHLRKLRIIDFNQLGRERFRIKI